MRLRQFFPCAARNKIVMPPSISMICSNKYSECLWFCWLDSPILCVHRGPSPKLTYVVMFCVFNLQLKVDTFSKLAEVSLRQYLQSSRAQATVAVCPNVGDGCTAILMLDDSYQPCSLCMKWYVVMCIFVCRVYICVRVLLLQWCVLVIEKHHQSGLTKWGQNFRSCTICLIVDFYIISSWYSDQGMSP
jgi:hypothetical protein